MHHFETPNQLLSVELSSHQSLEQIIHSAERSFSESQDFDWLIGIAFLLWKDKRYSEALDKLESVDRSYRINNIQYLLVYGMVARRIDGLELKALRAFREVILLEPERSDVYYNLANLYRDYSDNNLVACRAYEVCLSLDPNCSHFWINRAFSLNELDEGEQAISCFGWGLLLDPFNADAWNNMGLSFYGLEKFDQALACFKKSIALDSCLPSAHINLANVLLEECKPDLALEPLSKAVKFAGGTEDSPNALWNMSLVNLLLGDYEQGWSQYEARLTTKQFTDRAFPTSGPLLSSLGDLDKFTTPDCEQLLVWSEQGMGDSIQFCRYLLLLRQMGCSFQYMSRDPLFSLMRDWLGLGDLVIPDKSTDPQVDRRTHIPLMSFPSLFGTTLESIPALPCYLKKPRETPSSLLVDTPTIGINIGLVWASNPDNSAMYKRKSIPLDVLMPALTPLLELDLICLHTLQFGADAEQIQPWADHPRVNQWQSRISDFSDTAFVLEQMDLVISADTGVAHLAAAIGIPTWLLLPANADFRWLRDRSDCPWYPSMRLFRQRNRHDWLSVVAQLQSALDDLFMLELKALRDSTDSRLLLSAF